MVWVLWTICFFFWYPGHPACQPGCALPLGFILVLGPAVMSIETRLSNTSGRGPRLSMLSLHLVTYSFVLKEEARKGQDAGIWSFLVRVSSRELF